MINSTKKITLIAATVFLSSVSFASVAKMSPDAAMYGGIGYTVVGSANNGLTVKGGKQLGLGFQVASTDDYQLGKMFDKRVKTNMSLPYSFVTLGVHNHKFHGDETGGLLV